MHQLDQLIEAQRTLDPNLMKAKENLMALWRGQPTPMPEMFSLAPPHQGSKTTTTTATNDRCPQLETDKERQPNIFIPVQHASSSQATPTGMVYISSISLQAMVQRLSHAKSQLTQLVQQIRPWVHQAISDSEGRMQKFMVTIIQDYLSLFDAHTNDFKARVQQSIRVARPSDLTALQIEIQQLLFDVTTTLAALVALPETTPQCSWQIFLVLMILPSLPTGRGPAQKMMIQMLYAQMWGLHSRRSSSLC